MSLLLAVLLAAVAVNIGLVFLLFRESRASNGLSWVSWYSRPVLMKVRCEACDGCGVQMLHHGQWVILPHSQRGYTKMRKSMEFKAGTPNVRKCPACLGQCFRWRRKEGSG